MEMIELAIEVRAFERPLLWALLVSPKAPAAATQRNSPEFIGSHLMVYSLIEHLSDLNPDE